MESLRIRRYETLPDSLLGIQCSAIRNADPPWVNCDHRRFMREIQTMSCSGCLGGVGLHPRSLRAPFA